jgi:DNA-binding CsgD family transcriptional regulator
VAGDALVCPTLIGRDGPARRLRAFVDAVAGGERQIALVAGEAGLGKSRIVAEAAAYARARGFRVLIGASFPQDRACPFAPILDLLRAALGSLPPEAVAGRVRPFTRELAPLLPDLVPAAAAAGDVTGAPDVERDRRQLFVALAHCLLSSPEPEILAGSSSGSTHLAPALSPVQPICLVVEDLHWCDDVSLDLLAFLARTPAPGLPAAPLLILATYRADDAGAGLRGWLAQLDRARLANEVALAPLSRHETVQMVTATFAGVPPPVGLADAVHELAEGNPFRIEELLGALVAAGDVAPAEHAGSVSWRWSARPVHEWRLPRSLYEAVQERVAALSPSARELLTLAAVVGRRFDFDRLQELAHVDERTLLLLVKELVAARLVVEEADDRFAFRHALTHQAVYGELLARERVALHRTVAEMSEQHGADAPEAPVDDLAYHYSEAGVWPKALAYAQRAAERAHRLYAPRVELEHLNRAIHSCQRFPSADGVTLATLFLARARAHDTIGDAAASIQDARLALDLAQQAGDQRLEWQALIDLGLFWAGRDYARAGPCLDAALTLARSLGDPVLQAHSLNRLGNFRVNTEQPRDALPLHREALTIFERMWDIPGLAATLDLLGMAAFLSADLAGSIGYYEQAVPLMEAIDDRAGLVTALAMLSLRGGSYELGSATTDVADFAAGLRDGERAVDLAVEIGWPAGEAFALCQIAAARGCLGEYPRAFDLAERSRSLAWSINHVQWELAGNAVLGVLSLDVLAFERAATYLERALTLARQIRSTFWQQLLTGELAWTHTQAGALDEAAALLGPTPDAERPVQSLGERWLVFAHAHLALARQQPAEALRLFSRVTAPSIQPDPAGPDAAVSPDAALFSAPPAMTPRPGLGRVAALTALGRHAEAEAQARSIREIVQRQGAQPLIWRADVALGHLFAATGRPQDAQVTFASARQVVETLAASLPDDALRETFQRRALALLPRGHRPAARTATSARPGGLTARECDVAVLIAAGCTNREIADALVLGERTIETHVSNILGKLALPSRREVGRWATAHGLRPHTIEDAP